MCTAEDLVLAGISLFCNAAKQTNYYCCYYYYYYYYYYY